MYVGPRAKPAERMDGAYLDVIPAMHAASTHRDGEVQALVALRRGARRGARWLLPLERHLESAALER